MRRQSHLQERSNQEIKWLQEKQKLLPGPAGGAGCRRLENGLAWFSLAAGFHLAINSQCSQLVHTAHGADSSFCTPGTGEFTQNLETFRKYIRCLGGPQELVNLSCRF